MKSSNFYDYFMKIPGSTRLEFGFACSFEGFFFLKGFSCSGGFCLDLCFPFLVLLFRCLFDENSIKILRSMYLFLSLECSEESLDVHAFEVFYYYILLEVWTDLVLNPKSPCLSAEFPRKICFMRFEVFLDDSLLFFIQV